MNKIDLRLKYHRETGKYPISGNEASVNMNFGEDQDELIEIETGGLKDILYINNPLFPLLDYINWLEEQLIQ